MLKEGLRLIVFFGLYEHTDELLKEKNILIYESDGDEGIMGLVSQYKEFLSDRGRGKPERSVEHDMTVLSTVRKLRSDVKSSIEAGALLITCDYLLYRFDWETSREENRLACVVIPNLFWQILRPFVPSDLDFDRSFAETFALPEFRTIGSGASEACSKLLCLLAVYKDIPEETAARLLSNDLLIDGLCKIEDDKEMQEYVESAMAADNAMLIEEKAALAKQLEIERTQRGSREKEFEQERIELQKEKEKIEQELQQKEEKLGFLEKERKRAERIREIYAGVLGMVSGLVLVGLFEYIIYKIPWLWLVKHDNSYGLQGAFDIFIILLVLGLFNRKWKKWLWGSSVLSGIVFLILALLGGPQK